MAVNYNQRTLTENTQNFKKHYDSNIYVVFPEQHFSMKLGSIQRKFKVFIKQKGEQFGDPVASYSLIDKPGLRVYDNSGGVVLNVPEMHFDDINLGEWSYTFFSTDFNKKGQFDGEVIVTSDTTDSVIGKFKINVY
jgi:hypothetical protein